MAQNPKPTSILDSLGEEIIRIITPVSICMFLVVLLVSILNSPSSDSSNISIATIAYSENTSDSFWDKFSGALLNSLIFVAVITVTTFILVFLFYIRCTKFLKYYMGLSSFVVLGFMGGEIAVILIRKFSIPIDCITFCLLLLNFTVVGVLAIFVSKMGILITQTYLVVIGMLVAYWFSMLPEWTTWTLLVALALYDLAAVLLPGGPLRLLVELAMSRDEEIPALVYEARPVTYNDSGPMQRSADRRSWRGRSSVDSDIGESLNANASSSSDSTLGVLLSSEGRENETRLVIAERDSEVLAPLVERPLGIPNVQRDGRPGIEQSESWPIEGIGLGSSGAIKLGLGDFIFYSVLVGRAAMYDLMTVYACYLAIIAGLGITLMLLAIYQKALPALPVSILSSNSTMYSVWLISWCWVGACMLLGFLRLSSFGQLDLHNTPNNRHGRRCIYQSANLGVLLIFSQRYILAICMALSVLDKVVTLILGLVYHVTSISALDESKLALVGRRAFLQVEAKVSSFEELYPFFCVDSKK